MPDARRRNLSWRLVIAAWLAAIAALAALAATLAPVARATVGGVAVGLAISGTAMAALAIRLTAPKTGATAVGGFCDGQSFTVPARRPPRTIRLVSPDGRAYRYRRTGQHDAGRVIYRAE